MNLPSNWPELTLAVALALPAIRVAGYETGVGCGTGTSETDRARLRRARDCDARASYQLPPTTDKLGASSYRLAELDAVSVA